MPDTSTPLRALDDLAAEQHAAAGRRRARLDRRRLARARRPRAGWDVRDTIAHLADTDEMAIDDRDRRARRRSTSVAARARVRRGRHLSRACCAGRRRAGRRGARVVGARPSAPSATMLLALDPDAGCRGASGCAPPSFVTARLMETWAHGLDVHAALGAPSRSTPTGSRTSRGSRPARSPTRTPSPGREPPGEPLRVELTLPSGAPWTYGPDDAADRITGHGGRVLPRVRAPARRSTPTVTLRARGDARRADALARRRAAYPLSRRGRLHAAVLVRGPDARRSTRPRSSRRPRRSSAT